MTTLEVKDVVKIYNIRNGLHTSKLVASDHLNFTLESGKTIALVGQSGSGKSTIAKILLGLERPTSGQVLLNGKPYLHVRGLGFSYHKIVQMVFQDPYASLNPFHTVGHHIARPYKLHHPKASKEEVRQATLSLLERVRLTPAEDYIDRLPTELSGGQRQRVAIARALAPEPEMLIADEPVSALDVSIRLGVLNLLADLQRESHLGVLYITHDMATARHFSDEIMVMTKGAIVEQGPADDVILRPQNEYTKNLIAAAPDPERRIAELLAERKAEATAFATAQAGAGLRSVQAGEA